DRYDYRSLDRDRARGKICDQIKDGCALTSIQDDVVGCVEHHDTWLQVLAHNRNGCCCRPRFYRRWSRGADKRLLVAVVLITRPSMEAINEMMMLRRIGMIHRIESNHVNVSTDRVNRCVNRPIKRINLIELDNVIQIGQTKPGRAISVESQSAKIASIVEFIW